MRGERGNPFPYRDLTGSLAIPSAAGQLPDPEAAPALETKRAAGVWIAGAENKQAAFVRCASVDDS